MALPPENRTAGKATRRVAESCRILWHFSGVQKHVKRPRGRGKTYKEPSKTVGAGSLGWTETVFLPSQADSGALTEATDLFAAKK